MKKENETLPTEEEKEERETAEEILPLPENEEDPAPSMPAIDYAALAVSDLQRIKELCRDFEAIESLKELPFARRFAELRDLGLSVDEALFAVMPRRREEESGKSHLRSAVPRPAYTPADSLSHEEMRAAKDLFYGLSEKEINALYRRVKR
jgi:hypothetical protein